MSFDAPEKWRPRASSLGYLMTCDYRAAFDRALAEKKLTLTDEQAAELEAKKSSSPNADFGTCTHFHMQDGMRCVFPGDSKDFAPDPEQYVNAAKLFTGDEDIMRSRMKEVATSAAKHMPPSPDGKPWLAESAWKNKRLQGHIDFLSQNYEVIVDLKTTSRLPHRGYAKVEHVIQLVAYWYLVYKKTGVKPSKGFILYVDIQTLETCRVEIDFLSDGMKELTQQVEEYLNYLCSARLFKTAVPRMGSHCSESWCPYTSMCKSKYMPAPGTIKAKSTVGPSMAFTDGGI